MEYRR
jgi:hypothetical protein